MSRSREMDRAARRIRGMAEHAATKNHSRIERYLVIGVGPLVLEPFGRSGGILRADDDDFTLGIGIGSRLSIGDSAIVVTDSDGDRVLVSGVTPDGSDPPDPTVETETWTQTVPAAVWHVTHGLNKKPSVTLTNTAGDDMGDGYVQYIDNGHLDITFLVGGVPTAVAGKAELN